MSSSRDNILRRLRMAGSLAQAPLPASDWQAPGYPDSRRLEQFKAALLQAHAKIIETNEHDWPRQLVELAISRKLKNWLYGPESETGLTFARQACHCDDIDLIPYNRAMPAFKQTLFHGVDASITSAQAGIAETGSLLILPSVAEPRLMSLVPPVHVVLFREANLLNNFSELIEQQNWAKQGLPSNAVLVSGPSKTADIQQTLAYGAHGPSELIVMIIPKSAEASADHQEHKSR